MLVLMERAGFSVLSTRKQQRRNWKKNALDFDAVGSLFVVCASGLTAVVFLLQRCGRSCVAAVWPLMCCSAVTVRRFKHMYICDRVVNLPKLSSN